MQLFTHLLAPTDGTALSRAAAERAVDIAAAMKARVTFFHARPEKRQSFFGGEGGGYVDQMPREEFERQAIQRANEYLDALEAIAKTAGVTSARVIGDAGAPYEGIIATATAHGTVALGAAPRCVTAKKAPSTTSSMAAAEASAGQRRPPS